ncbi:MAG: prenyltransferase, partial [Luteibaculum sp.]
MLLNWIKALRLRTIPLAISGIVLAAGLANFSYPKVWGLMMAVAVLLQISSNLANDLGDFLKGSDTNRKGEERMVSSGKISPKAIKLGIIFCSLLALVLGLLCIYLAPVSLQIKLMLLAAGLLGIWAALA